MTSTAPASRNDSPTPIARVATAQIIATLLLLSLYTYGFVGLVEVNRHVHAGYPWLVVYGACSMFASVGLIAVCVWHLARITSDQQQRRTGHRSRPAG